MKIIVYGSPAPQGSKKHVGNGIMVESSRALPSWRECVHYAGVQARNGAAPMDGPLVARMVFTMRKPKSAPKSRVTYPCTMPDVSKLARSTEDSLKTAGVYVDDARIVGYSRLWKVYPNEDPEALEAPGVRIEISTLAEFLEATAVVAMPGPLFHVER